MSGLRASMVGFDIAPTIHPKYGAWGTSPTMTEVDMPLLTRCLALEHDGRKLLWFTHDLCGESCARTDVLRQEVSEGIGLNPEQLIWSTSQTHASPAMPGSPQPGGCSITVRGDFDQAFCDAERKRFIDDCIESGKEALAKLRPAQVWSGRGYCDNISYNSRFPMPTGGVKFSRNYAEAIQSGRYFDPTVGLVRFDDADGKPIGTIFNFNSHPATLINDKYVSPDYVGTARKLIEQAADGAPAAFVQGFCGNIHNYYMFTGPDQAKLLGQRLGQAAIKGLGGMAPVRAEPLNWHWRTVQLDCQPMYTREQLEHEIQICRAFQEELNVYPHACWVGGINVPEFMSVEDRNSFVEVTIQGCQEGLRMLEAGETARTSLPITLGALRIGDVYAVLSPGENFAETGRDIRQRSAFPHTLICGDTNGQFGYIGDDEEISRGGFETDTYWRLLYIDGFRTPLAKGSAKRVIEASVDLLNEIGPA